MFLKRSPIKKKRSKPRPGRLEGAALDALRDDCFARDGGHCVRCRKKLWREKRFDGDPDAYDMAHKRNKRMHGDNLKNVQAECHDCHMKSHNAGGKPCPPKPKMELEG